MTIKVVIVLGFLLLMTFFMVSAVNVKEVVSGFFQFGTIPLRAETVVVGPHFTLTEKQDANVYTIKGTIEDDQPLVTTYIVSQAGETETFRIDDDLPPSLARLRQQLVERAEDLAKEGRFYFEDTKENMTVRVAGRITPERMWQPDKIEIEDADGVKQYDRLDAVPGRPGERARALVTYQGVERVGLIGYVRQHGRLPDLNWAMLAAFAAIAGAGGMSNSLLSNYARDKGWGMGKLVGAIPSAVGGTRSRFHTWARYFPSANPTWPTGVAGSGTSCVTRRLCGCCVALLVWRCPAWYHWNSFATCRWRVTVSPR